MLKTKFRLTECMWYYGTEYQEIAKTAITEDGKRHKIQTMDDGTEYFTIDNPYSEEECYDGFYGCIKDAVDAVKEHYADCIKGNPLPLNVFQSGMFPIIFLDREKGEEAWNKSIEGWKDAKFGYQIKCGGKNSFSGYQPIDKNGEYTTFKPEDTEYFETKKEAEEKMNSFIEKSKNAYKEYTEAKTDGKKYKICESLFSCGIAFHFLMEMIDNPEITDFKKFPEFGYEIQQSVLPA